MRIRLNAECADNAAICAFDDGQRCLEKGVWKVQVEIDKGASGIIMTAPAVKSYYACPLHAMCCANFLFLEAFAPQHLGQTVEAGKLS